MVMGKALAAMRRRWVYPIAFTINAVPAPTDTTGRLGGPRFFHLVVYEADAAHNEQAWAKRLPQALTFLFPSRK